MFIYYDNTGDKMVIKGRLKLIADKVPQCEIVCDIGTDHAYVPIYLVLKKICKFAIAADVNSGPVLAAKKNIVKYGLDKYIEARQGNGLECLSMGEADCIIIAGMGGLLIREILQKDIEKAASASLLILQPMNSIELVREWILSSGFSILDEELCKEGEKIYNVITCKWIGQKEQVDAINFYIGERLIRKNDPLLDKYLQKELNRIEKVINGLKRTNNPGNELKVYTWLAYEIKKLLRRNSNGS